MAWSKATVAANTKPFLVKKSEEISVEGAVLGATVGANEGAVLGRTVGVTEGAVLFTTVGVTLGVGEGLGPLFPQDPQAAVATQSDSIKISVSMVEHIFLIQSISFCVLIEMNDFYIRTNIVSHFLQLIKNMRIFFCFFWFSSVRISPLFSFLCVAF